MKLSGGNIWNGLLTIHQLLRQEARFYDVERYNFVSTPEQAETFFNKFIDIRGDLRERGPGYTGDHAGTWYRMWGAMLFRLMPFDELDFTSTDDPKTQICLNARETNTGFFQRMQDSLLADMVFLGDEVILKMGTDQDKWGKYNIDEHASYATGSLFLSLMAPKNGVPSVTEANCRARNYLKKSLLRSL